MTRDVVVATRRRPARRALASALVLPALVAGSACADESDSSGGATDVQTIDGFEATAVYLQQAAEQTTAEGYRVEMFFALSEEADDTVPPLMSGEVNGDEYHYVLDFGSMMDEMAGAFGDAGSAASGVLDELDTTMEMAGDPESMYIRAPMFADIAAMAGGDAPGPIAGLADLGDGWGHVDMAALGDQLPSDLAAAMGGQGVDPQVVVDMIGATEGVEDLGTDEVRGTSVHGVAADVTLGDLLEASGQDPDAFADISSFGDSSAVDTLYDITTPVEVWVDDEGYLRRMSYGWGFDDIAEAMGADAGDVAGTGMGGMHFSYVMDMFDYGSEVDFEVPADAVDITDAFAAVAEG